MFNDVGAIYPGQILSGRVIRWLDIRSGEASGADFFLGEGGRISARKTVRHPNAEGQRSREGVVEGVDKHYFSLLG